MLMADIRDYFVFHVILVLRGALLPSDYLRGRLYRYSINGKRERFRNDNMTVIIEFLVNFGAVCWEYLSRRRRTFDPRVPSGVPHG